MTFVHFCVKTGISELFHFSATDLWTKEKLWNLKIPEQKIIWNELPDIWRRISNLTACLWYHIRGTNATGPSAEITAVADKFHPAVLIATDQMKWVAL